MTEMIPWLERVDVGAAAYDGRASTDALRREHPELVMIGHYDKMVMNRGEEAIARSSSACCL